MAKWAVLASLIVSVVCTGGGCQTTKPPNPSGDTSAAAEVIARRGRGEVPDSSLDRVSSSSDGVRESQKPREPGFFDALFEFLFFLPFNWIFDAAGDSMEKQGGQRP
jgi:hypothetical protein